MNLGLHVQGDVWIVEKQLTVADFFCGAGGWSEGFRQAGFKVSWALDNWVWARKTHKLNHPETLHPGLDMNEDLQGDILAIDVARINEIVPDTEIIVGSPPCVSFSSSNNGGKADKQSGINLIEKFLQIVAVKKHKQKSTLKYWLMENVPNSRFHIQGSYTFAQLGLDSKTLKRYGIEKHPNSVALNLDRADYRIYDAAQYGVPQHRRRFITGDFPEPVKILENDFVTLGQILNTLSRNGPIITDPLYSISIPVEEVTDHFYDTEIHPFEWMQAKAKKTQARYYGRMSFPEDETRPSRTIMATRSVIARESMIIQANEAGKYRAPTIREVASLTSFPITYLFQGADESDKYRLVGNAVCPRLASAIATAILAKENIVMPSESVLHQPPIQSLHRNLSKEPPPKKIPRDKYSDSNFAEIVPNLKVNNFRVELDNNSPRKGNDLKWSASIHHATGAKNMKHCFPHMSSVKALYNQIPDKHARERFIREVEQELVKRIPSTATFQNYYCTYKKDSNFLSPYEALEVVKQLVERNFPEDDWREEFIDNYGLQFKGGKKVIEKIPARIIAALYACKRIEAATRGGNA